MTDLATSFALLALILRSKNQTYFKQEKCGEVLANLTAPRALLG